MASGYSDLSEIRKNGQPFGGYPKPPKIDLLNEMPRRESVVEQQLNSLITRSSNNSTQQYEFNQSCLENPAFMDQQVFQQQQQRSYLDDDTHNLGSIQSKYLNANNNYQHEQPLRKTVTTIIETTKTSEIGGFDSTRAIPQQQEPILRQPPPIPGAEQQQQHLGYNSTNISQLERELLEKEARLKREIAYLNLYDNPWSRPRQIRDKRREPEPKSAKNDQRWIREFPTASPNSRPNSRASNKSTTEADLMEKAERLLKDVEEIEKKTIKSQQILIEPGAVRDVGSSGATANSNNSSIQTKIIKVPNYHVNNKSPLPFAYDNFSTLGVRGNIASVGAAEPEKPYPPIFPTVVKTPTKVGKNSRHY